MFTVRRVDSRAQIWWKTATTSNTEPERGLSSANIKVWITLRPEAQIDAKVWHILAPKRTHRAQTSQPSLPSKAIVATDLSLKCSIREETLKLEKFWPNHDLGALLAVDCYYYFDYYYHWLWDRDYWIASDCQMQYSTESIKTDVRSVRYLIRTN